MPRLGLQAQRAEEAEAGPEAARPADAQPRLQVRGEASRELRSRGKTGTGV